MNKEPYIFLTRLVDETYLGLPFNKKLSSETMLELCEIIEKDMNEWLKGSVEFNFLLQSQKQTKKESLCIVYSENRTRICFDKQSDFFREFDKSIFNGELGIIEDSVRYYLDNYDVPSDEIEALKEVIK